MNINNYSTKDADIFDNLSWQNYVYDSKQEIFICMDDDQPFTLWNGGKGRPSKGKAWDQEVIKRFNNCEQEQLTSLVLRQTFYYGYLKTKLKIPLKDPYDVDGFIVSYQANVIPLEVKEKSPTQKGDFGLDVGRILMMLRLCLSTNQNAIYVIKEVNNNAKRTFIDWKYITLSDMIMYSSWNLQGGGRSMTGGTTQTVMFSRELFNSFTKNNFKETWLEKNASLQENVKTVAIKLSKDLNKFLGLSFS